MHIRIRSLALAAVACALVAAPAPAFGLKGPPWISIELPANPYDKSTRDAFLLVHAFHHGTAMGFIVTGTAEGMLNGDAAVAQAGLRRDLERGRLRSEADMAQGRDLDAGDQGQPGPGGCRDGRRRPGTRRRGGDDPRAHHAARLVDGTGTRLARGDRRGAPSARGDAGTEVVDSPM